MIYSFIFETVLTLSDTQVVGEEIWLAEFFGIFLQIYLIQHGLTHGLCVQWRR